MEEQPGQYCFTCYTQVIYWSEPRPCFITSCITYSSIQKVLIPLEPFYILFQNSHNLQCVLLALPGREHTCFCLNVFPNHLKIVAHLLKHPQIKSSAADCLNQSTSPYNKVKVRESQKKSCICNKPCRGKQELNTNTSHNSDIGRVMCRSTKNIMVRYVFGTLRKMNKY